METIVKSNQKGFTALEIILTVVIVGVLGGVIGYIVSNIGHKTDNKNNVATPSKTQATASQSDDKQPIACLLYTSPSPRDS